MSLIEGQILGAETVQARFNAVQESTRRQVRQAVAAQGRELLRLVKQKLSDDVLHVRSGRLRHSMNTQNTDDGSTFRSSTGTNVVYARVHELGFQGTVQVREHLRQTKNGAVSVSAHHMRMNIPKRSFLASSLEARKVEIRVALIDAIKGATDGR